MKLCPECDFIYEDDQSFCDMDGKELVSNSQRVGPTANVPNLLTETPEVPAAPPSHGVAAAVIVVVLLAALVVALYLVRRHQTRSGAASEAATQLPERSADQSQPQSASENPSAQPAASESVSSETTDADTGEKSPEVSVEVSSSQTNAASGSESSQSSTSTNSLAHTRLAASPVSAGTPSGNNHSSVIVRLNNGAAIKADEAWEKREGIWYRQAGMVTFLKRNRVTTIERLPAPVQPSKTTSNVQDQNGKAQNTAAKEKLRITRLEPIQTKKPSGFSSFLKKTGRILKKPFKL